MPPRVAGTFKKSGDESVASPDFRLSGRNSPSDPANIDLEAATVRSVLIQLANFSLDFQLVKDECFVENAETDTYTVDRAKVVALFQDVMSILAQQGGWRLAPTKAEVAQLGSSPSINFSRLISDNEYRFAWPTGHPRLASIPNPNATPNQGSGSNRVTPVQVPRNDNNGT